MNLMFVPSEIPLKNIILDIFLELKYDVKRDYTYKRKFYFYLLLFYGQKEIKKEEVKSTVRYTRPIASRSSFSSDPRFNSLIIARIHFNFHLPLLFELFALRNWSNRYRRR